MDSKPRADRAPRAAERAQRLRRGWRPALRMPALALLAGDVLHFGAGGEI